jgi:fluoroquinolone resistance protein
MQQEYLTYQTFNKINYTQHPLAKGEYENCTFKNCDFSNSDLTNIKFIDCLFEGCNLSLAKLTMTAFQDIKFRNCKMLGLHFENCNEFGLSVGFEDCNLNHCSFYQRKLKKTFFKNVTLQEADFAECDLSSSVFDNCDLSKATFDFTNLEKADLRSSFNYSIDPEKNRIKKAKFSLTGLAGLLDKYDIEIDVKIL